MIPIIIMTNSDIKIDHLHKSTCFCQTNRSIQDHRPPNSVHSIDETYYTPPINNSLAHEYELCDLLHNKGDNTESISISHCKTGNCLTTKVYLAVADGKQVKGAMIS